MMTNKELSDLTKEYKAKVFLEHKGMAAIKKEELNALFSVYHAVEFFYKFDQERLPEELKHFYLQSKAIIDKDLTSQADQDKE